MKIQFPAILPFLLLLLMTWVLPAVPAHAESARYKRTVEKYKLPDVVLINQNGKKVHLASILNTDQPVVVDFIYGTCTTYQ